MSTSTDCCCSDELLLMKSTDYRLELKSVTEFVKGMNVCIDIVGSGDQSKQFVIPDMKSIRNYIELNPRLKAIGKAVNINVQVMMDMEESKLREKINGKDGNDDSPNDEFRIEMKSVSLKRKQRAEDVIDYIDPLTNGIIPDKLYADQKLIEDELVKKEHQRVEQNRIDNMTHKQRECQMFYLFNQNEVLIRRYEREEKEYATRFKVDQAKI